MAKPQYTEEKGTPLLFLELLEIILIIGVVTRSLILLSSFSSEDALSLTFRVIDFLFIVVAALRIPARRWIGVLAVYGWVAFYAVASALFGAVFYSAGYVDDALSALAKLVSYSVVGALLWIYFSKRRLLFSPLPKGYTPPEPEKPVIDISDIPFEVVEEYRSDYVYPPDAPPRPGETFTIRPPKKPEESQSAPEAPAKPRKTLRGAPVWSWVIIGVLSLSCCGLICATVFARHRVSTLEAQLNSHTPQSSSSYDYRQTLKKYGIDVDDGEKQVIGKAESVIYSREELREALSSRGD